MALSLSTWIDSVLGAFHLVAKKYLISLPKNPSLLAVCCQEPCIHPHRLLPLPPLSTLLTAALQG